MKTWTTEIIAIDPRDGIVKRWDGPRVPGNTRKEAELFCMEHQMGYCKVEAEWIEDQEVSQEEMLSIVGKIARQN